MTQHSGRRIISTVVVAAALAGGLACGAGTAAADSSDSISSDSIGWSSDALSSEVLMMPPILEAGVDALGSACTAVRNLLLGQNYCLAPPFHGATID
ncbi:hypothetical protein [Rhodococcus daqingensis]|uniref:Uncharacterized protein n=1 Tax=Rhodococcus daqingensis TaxID=2479363 RepID=A0ABW2RZ56_9NOCA